MTDPSITGPVWIPVFLATLSKTRKVKSAVEAAKVTHGTIYFQRRRNMRFAQAWDAALNAEPAKNSAASQTMKPIAKRTHNSGWRTAFLEQLAQTSNVRAAAAHANVPISTIYTLKQNNPAFAAKWRKALYEGYEQLEMEVLAHLRGNLPDRKIDIANAIRQLAAHRTTIAQIRALEEEEDEQAVLDSIDALIDRMRGATGTNAGPTPND